MAKNAKRKDGLYRYWYNGKQFYDKVDAIAKKKRDDYKYECEHGIEKPDPVSVIDLAEKWLPVAKAGVDNGTYNQYATIMEKMTGVIGDKLVSSVRAEDIKNVWATYVGLSQSYISKAKFLYKAFFQYAIDNKYCTVSPMLAESAKPHRGSKGTHRCLTEAEVNLIESVPHRVQPGAMFMLKAGLRRGEVLALKKTDIHDGRIYVLKAVKFVNNRPVIKGTKNESSERDIPLFAPLKPVCDMVDKYVFPDEHGNLCSETAFKRAWQSYLSDLSAHVNGVQKRWYHRTKEWKETHPKEYMKYLELLAKGKKEEAEEFRLTGWREVSFRPHDLRHTFVTMCRDNGVDIRVCMDWCGHGSERMILEIYDHPSKTREQSAMEKLYPTVKKQLNDNSQDLKPIEK